MVTCLIGFMGILGFMGTITLSSRNQSPHRMVFFTFHSSLFTLSEAKLLSQENIHYLVGISHGDCIVTIYIGCSHVEVRDA